jgi:citryl-CoA lyase
MKWQTKISRDKSGEHYIRGNKLGELIRENSFTEVIFLLLVGRLAKRNETAMLDAILVAGIEHGISVPSAFVPRTSVSVGNAVNAALAAGLLSIGDWHGGAIERCMITLSERTDAKDIVRSALEKKKIIAGFGHKTYKSEDPRSQALLQKSQELGFHGEYIDKAQEIEQELEKQKGKKLVLNVDGAMAAILLTLGFNFSLGKGIFALSRLPGMLAHIEEEMLEEKPYRRLDDSDVE